MSINLNDKKATRKMGNTYILLTDHIAININIVNLIAVKAHNEKLRYF